MPNVEHNSLAGSEVHEPKGIQNASSGQIYLANGTGSGNWTTPTLDTIDVAVPANATSAGTAGQIAFDANYIYVCTATNTWKRVAIVTW